MVIYIERGTKRRTMSEQSKIHMVLRKEKKYGRDLYYPTS